MVTEIFILSFSVYGKLEFFIKILVSWQTTTTGRASGEVFNFASNGDDSIGPAE